MQARTKRSRRPLGPRDFALQVTLVGLIGAVLLIGSVFAMFSTLEIRLPLSTQSRDALDAKLIALDERNPMALVGASGGFSGYGDAVYGAAGGATVADFIRVNTWAESWRVERLADGGERWTEDKATFLAPKRPVVVEFGPDGLPTSLTVPKYDGASDMWHGTSSYSFDYDPVFVMGSLADFKVAPISDSIMKSRERRGTK